MKIKKITATLWVAALAVSITGCSELTDLDVVNENAPDKDRALNTPGDVEALIGGAGASWWNAIQNWSNEGSWAAMVSTMGDESSLSWGNWGIRDQSSEPRVAWNNSSTYASESSLSDMYRGLYGTLSAVRDGIVAIDEGLVIEDAATTQRALAFAKLMQGIAHGYLGLFINQGNILNETTELTDATGSAVTLDFVTYQEMVTEAIANLNASIAISDATEFDTPTTWFNGITLDNEELSQLAHSFIARFMANVARTDAERQAVAWGTVKTEIAAGITSNFAPVGDDKGGGGGPADGGGPWHDVVKWMMESSTWARADYRSVGGVAPDDSETDIAGGYAAWLLDPVADRTQYSLNTNDKRVQAVAGNDAGGDGLDFGFGGDSPHLANRGTYHWSLYYPTRYEGHRPNGGGPMTFMTTTEMDLLLAEAHLRVDAGVGAAALINLTRVGRGGLTAAQDTDADLFSKLYYEKFIEQFGLASGLAWTERRGAKEIAVASSTAGMTLFGLVPRTPRHFPVPGKELEVLQLPLYTFGGAGPDLAPAAGVLYGAPATAVYQFNSEWTAAEKLRHLMNMGNGSKLPSYY